MLKDTSIGLRGNDRYEGFGIDIIDQLSLLYGFKYKFVVQEDQIYGSPINGTPMWNGLIGRVMSGVSLLINDLNKAFCRLLSPFLFFLTDNLCYFRQEVDLAITDLTINSDRITALDFTPSFMNLGLLSTNSVQVCFPTSIRSYCNSSFPHLLQVSPCCTESQHKSRRQRSPSCRRFRRSFGFI